MKSSDAYGHVPCCVEVTVQPYRKSITPDKCNHCRAYWQGRADASQAVRALPTRPGAGMFRIEAALAAAGVDHE